MNLMDLFIKVGVKDEASAPIKKLTGAVGNGLKTAAKIGVAAIGAASTALGYLGKKSIDAYANYEQLVGGVETLFGAGGRTLKEYAEYTGLVGEEAQKAYGDLMTAQKTVMNYAANAYKTAGMSANEYMETVTGFSASLIQSLGGDTLEAAKIADMAITDMADNANKMGTDISSIQNAYQGFAKQNYTMLDNLKLGYGGTKSEMERLLADAEKLTGVKYDINNLADVYSAIHAVQTEIGITGTTAKEAEKTISGSLSRVKAAWKNLLVGMSTGENLDELFDNLVESAEIAFQNILPVAMKTLQSLPRIVRRVAPLLSKEIPKIIRELLPALVSAAKELIVSLAESLPELLNAVFDVLPDIISAVIEIAGAVFDGLVEAIPELLTKVWDAIDEAIEKSDFAPTWDRIKESASKAFEEISQYTDTLSEPFENMSESFGTLKEDIDEIVKKIKEWEEEHHVIETVFDQVSKTMKGGILLLGFAFNGLAWVLDRIHDGINGIKTVFDTVKTAGAEAAGWIVTKWNEVKDAVQEVVGALNPLGTIVGWLGGGVSGSGATSGGRSGHFAIGNDYVPYDNYPAMLHRGEAVLTAREADEWRRGEGHGRQIVNNFTFNGVSQSDLDFIVAYVNRGLG